MELVLVLAAVAAFAYLMSRKAKKKDAAPGVGGGKPNESGRTDKV